MDVTELEENLFAASDAKVPFPNQMFWIAFVFPCLTQRTIVSLSNF